MKKNILFGIMLAVGFLFSSATFASPATSEPVYTLVDSDTFILAVWPPAVPANVDTGYPDLVMAMAGGGSDSKTVDKNCMAGCLIDKRRQIVAGFYQLVAGFYQLNVDQHRTVLARGFESEPIETPTKVPVFS